MSIQLEEDIISSLNNYHCGCLHVYPWMLISFEAAIIVARIIMIICSDPGYVLKLDQNHS